RVVLRSCERVAIALVDRRAHTTAPLCRMSFFFYRHGDHQDLHSFPTRRSSDLDPAMAELAAHTGAVEARAAGIRWTFAPMVDIADRKSTRLNSSHSQISYAVFCLKKKRRRLSARSLYRTRQPTGF